VGLQMKKRVFLFLPSNSLNERSRAVRFFREEKEAGSAFKWHPASSNSSNAGRD